MVGLFLEPSSVKLMVYGLKFHTLTSRILVLPSLINTALANQIAFQARKQYGKTHIVSVMQYFMSEV